MNAPETRGLILGPDVYTNKSTILPPKEGTPVEIVVPKKRLDASRPTKISMRSRYAQLGFDTSQQAGTGIQTAQEHGYTSMHVTILNRATRPIELAPGPVFRMYQAPQEIITGEALTEAVEDGQIQIEGDKYDWGYYALPKAKKNIGIWMRIDPHSRRWIPPVKTDSPLTISAKPGGDFRAEVDQYLTEPPPDNEPHLAIAQTSGSLQLQGVHGFIDRRLPHNRTHSNSVLLGADQTKWPVRTEDAIIKGKQREILVVTFSKA